MDNSKKSSFIKTFIIAFIVIMIIATPLSTKVIGVLELIPGSIVLAEEVDFKILIPSDSQFFDAFTNTNRINILVLGVDNHNLTDTIMLASFDIDNKFIDIISIPRDTYYKGTATNKINAAYKGNPVNTALAVSKVLMHIPINYYISLDYQGVANIVDEIGGVPMDIQFHMKYDDPKCKPPLHIDIKPGPQVLDGKTSVEFLRFRQANKGSGYKGYPDADFGRIKAQQEFVKSAIKQSLGLNFRNAITAAFDNVESDVSIKTALYLATKAIGVDSENIRTYRLPLKSTNMQPDESGIADLLTEIYSLGVSD